MRPEGLGKLEKCIYFNGFRTRVLSACIILTQCYRVPPKVPVEIKKILDIRRGLGIDEVLNSVSCRKPILGQLV
jgi:hypothetical protein